MSKASLIRQIVAAGYSAKSPNTLRRWSLDDLQALLASLEPAIEQTPYESSLQAMMDASPDYTPEGFVPHVVSEDMAAYALSLRQRDPAPIKVERPLSRWIALAITPWTFLGQVCGIA
jgi:hypothetical protein